MYQVIRKRGLHLAVLLFLIGCNTDQENSNSVYQLKVVFLEGNGLRTDTPVTHGGEKIAKITSLEVEEGGKILAKIEFKPGVKIPLNSRFLLASDFLDTKSIEIVYSGEDSYYHTGSSITGKISTENIFDTSRDAQKLLDSLKRHSDSVLLNL